MAAALLTPSIATATPLVDPDQFVVQDDSLNVTSETPADADGGSDDEDDTEFDTEWVEPYDPAME
ncbi:hypothetical protein [Leucobacter manosquensis]|uniref:Uncharacterized protein n=1 Tax=Leucobacter manosquensis TaxID=2810611 RepID=A0ABS5M6Y2_9MICO|nr:hypothetical protein [Leucobacter manosquensis]MBS3182965.1 hypothetical protein [Leucobacter manosquensis]